MSPSPTRRGLLRGLLAALLGWGSTRVAAATTAAPPRCPHYYDGLLWASDRAGETGYYRRDSEGCPYCRPAQEPPPDPYRSVTYYSADGRVVATHGAHAQVTTYVYDSFGRGRGPKEPPPQSA